MEQRPYDEEIVNLQQYVHALRRRWWVILAALLVAQMAAYLITARTRPAYQAESKLVVRTSWSLGRGGGGSENPLGDLLLTADPDPLKTQIEVLGSAPFLEEVFKTCKVPPGSGVRVSSEGDSDTNIVTIRVESAIPIVAARVANAVASGYVDRTRVQSMQEIERAREFVEEQANGKQRELQVAEDSLRTYQRLTGAPDRESQHQSRAQELFALQSQLRQNEAEMTRLQALMRRVRVQLAQQPVDRTITAVQENPQAAVLEGKLTELNLERETLLQSYQPGSQRVRAMDAQIARVQAKLDAEPKERTTSRREPNPRRDSLLASLDSYEAELEGTRAQQTQLRVQLSLAQARLREMPSVSGDIRMAQLQRERDMAERTYLFLASKLHDLRVRENSRASLARVMEEARTPRAPVRPRPSRNRTLALALGLLVGCALAVLLELMDDRIVSAEEADRLQGLPVLGQIPALVDERCLVPAMPSLSPAAEGYRSLRANIDFSSFDVPLTTLGITSVRPGEGKSLTAVNLALSMAMDGRCVILVDADLRWPSVHSAFGLEVSPGLTEVLSGEVSLDEALRVVPEQPLLVLPAGAHPDKPTELLNTGGMRHLIRELANRADLVIFDLPPCVPFTDAQVLGSKLEGMVLVAEAGEARKAEVEQAHKMLRRARIRVLGLVLNKIRRTRGGPHWQRAYYRSRYADSASTNGRHNGHDGQALSASSGGSSRNTSSSEER
jgi:capsular exopolysaccharide synthesis family protein